MACDEIVSYIYVWDTCFQMKTLETQLMKRKDDGCRIVIKYIVAIEANVTCDNLSFGFW